MIELSEVVYDKRARNGTWCTLKYNGHTHGCPNFPACTGIRVDFEAMNYANKFKWFAVIEEFNLENHSLKMKQLHPKWSEKQCRCVLYWQPNVTKKLHKKTRQYLSFGDILLNIPEANGINVFETLKKVGIELEKTNPKIVKKVMLIGKNKGDVKIF